MGSFNATCIVSGLPIEAGTDVRYLALTENVIHRGNEHICCVSGRWQVRTVPLRGKYNDYGNVEKIEPGLAERVFFKSFDVDVEEFGVGDNPYHDVHVRKGMNRDDWLIALQKGRVYVRSHQYPKWEPGKLKELLRKQDEASPKYIPTMSRVQKILTSGRHEDFLVDQLNPGFIRIRVNGYGKDHVKKLKALTPYVHAAGFTSMLTAGTGRGVSEYAEMLVAPLPRDPNKTQDFFSEGVGERKEENKLRPVSLAMIREDVWKILLGMKLHGYRVGDIGIEYFRDSVLSLHKEEVEFQKKLETVKDPYERIRMETDRKFCFDDMKNANIIRVLLNTSEGVSGFSVKKSYELAKELVGSPEEMEAFLMDMAETLFAESVYSSIGGQWHPTTNAGQDGDWKAHREFLTKLLTIRGRYEESE